MRLGRIQEKSKPHRRRGPQPLKPAFAFSAQPNKKKTTPRNLSNSPSLLHHQSQKVRQRLHIPIQRRRQRNKISPRRRGLSRRALRQTPASPNPHRHQNQNHRQSQPRLPLTPEPPRQSTQHHHQNHPNSAAKSRRQGTR